MRYETQAKSEFRPVEKLLWLAFLAGAYWAGSQVWGFLNHSPTTAVRQWEGQRPMIGAEWTEVRDFRLPASVEGWEGFQRGLDRRLHQVLGRTLELGLLYAVTPASLRMPANFEDYALMPSAPVPGSVVRLGKSASCVVFAWSAIPLSGVRYTLEIAKTRDFKHYRSFGSESALLRIEVAKKADYFWRVRALLGTKSTVSPVSTLMVLDPPFSAEELRTRELAARVVRPDAWLADLRFCP